MKLDWILQLFWASASIIEPFRVIQLISNINQKGLNGIKAQSQDLEPLDLESKIKVKTKRAPLDRDMQTKFDSPSNLRFLILSPW